MNRRNVVRGGLGLLTLGAFGRSWGTPPCDPTFSGEPGSSCGLPGPGDGSTAITIESAAAGMSSNTWLKIGDSSDAGTPTATLRSLSLTPSATTRSAFEFSSTFFWNSDAKELHFRGGGASSGGGNLQRHFRYRDSTGEWDAVTPWLTGQSWIHQWAHFCGDPQTGDLYYRKNPNDDIHKWTYQPYPWTSSDATGSDSWPYFGQVGSGVYLTTAALGFFPDYNDGDGGLVFVETYGGDTSVLASDSSLTKWSGIGPADVFGSGNGGYEYNLYYCPGQKWMLTGGGKVSGGSSTARLAKIEADGTCTQLNDLPFIHGTGEATGKIVAHPNGRIFAIDFSGGNLYEYSEAGDSWSTGSLAALPSFGFSVGWSPVCMIPEHNCIYVLVKAAAATSTIQEWLYKI